MNNSCIFSSSIAKKHIVAFTGLGLVLFILVHLSGNLNIYGGATAYNDYAHKLKSFGILLWMARAGLLLTFLTHVIVTVLLVLENIQARGLVRYAKDNPREPRSLSTRIMPLSGIYIFCYLIWHLFDFSLSNTEGPRSVIHGVSQGIYGVVVNSFSDPLHSSLYILAMCFLGLHLVHGVGSVIQTFGYNDSRWTPAVMKFTKYFSLVIVLAYCSIPMYVMFVLAR